MGLAPFQIEKDVWDEIGWYKSIYVEGSRVKWGITQKDFNKVIGSHKFFSIYYPIITVLKLAMN